MIRTVVTHGYSNGAFTGTIPLVALRGYIPGAPPPPPSPGGRRFHTTGRPDSDFTQTGRGSSTFTQGGDDGDVT